MSSTNRRPLNTLVIGGDVDQRRIIGEVGRRRGHRVVFCAGPEEVVAPDRAPHFELVLLDWSGPAEVAALTCQQLRQHPACELAVIVTLADPLDLSDTELMIKAGANDCLAKPLDVPRLVARLGFLEQWAHGLMERFWAEAAMKESEDQLSDLFENTPIGIYQSTPDGRILMANPSMARMLGYESFAEMASLNLEQGGFWPTYPREKFKEAMERDGEVRGMEACWIRPDGRLLFVRENARAVRGADGRITAYAGTVEDITDQRQAEQALRESQERYSLAALGANDGLWDWDLTTNSVYYSPRWKEMLGYGEPEVDATPEAWLARVHPDDLEALRADLEAHLKGLRDHFESEHRIRHRDGSYRWVLTRGLVVRNDENQPMRVAGSQTDTTDRRAAEERALHTAFHDRLTGLPNRTLFLDRLRHTAELGQRWSGYSFAVIFLDLDRFKLVNESLGHDVGEQILHEVGRRLEACLRPGDTLARVGGDKFAFLLEDIRHIGEATNLADVVLEQLIRPILLAGSEVFVSASLGIAPSSPMVERSGDLLRDAEIAMYRAKAQGRARYVVFDPTMRERAVARLQIETHLRHAMERDELRVFYQPIIHLDTGKIAGFEALIRWQHPELGLIPPSKFVHVAEETGLIVPIGHWVLDQACHTAKRWQSTYPSFTELTMAVNLSATQFNRPQLVNDVQGILTATGIDPTTLKLEITESVLMEDKDSATKLLNRLKGLRVQLGIDDFGTGYSSFSHLQLFPIDTLKIDRSFVTRMGVNGERPEIVDTMITLGRNLQMSVVAEGVETPGQLDTLRRRQCGFAQGYLFSQPVDTNTAEAMLVRSPTW